MFRRCVRLASSVEWLGYLCSRKIHTNSARVLYSTFNKDLPNPILPTPLSKAYTHDTDILLDQLRKSKTVERILELSSNHLDVMNAQHIVTLLQGIHEHSRVDGFSSEALMENQVFQSVCSRLMKIIRILDSQELITVYKVLSTLGIRNNSYVMASILKMIGGHLNHMSLGQITFLSFLLSKQKHNPLVDGLRLALPLVLQVQIEQQLDSDNMSQVADCLQLACRSRLKPATIQKIVSTILKKAKSLSPTNATTILFSLLVLETPVDGYKELLNYSLEVVTKNIELSDEKRVLEILRLCRSQGFYHSPFFFQAAKKVVLEKWGLESTWEVMKIFSGVQFFPSDMMDHFVSVLCLEADTLRTSSNYSILNCVEYLTATGYRPPHLSAALRILCSCENKIVAMHEKNSLLLVKFLSCLAMLGHFPEKYMAPVLDEEYLFDAWSKSRKLGRGKDFERYMFSLIWSLEVFDQQDNFQFPIAVLKSLTQSACEKFSNHECPLQKFIENGLGASQFLQSGIFTHDGIFIDHMLAMRSGNYPVSLQHIPSNQSSSIRTQSLSFVEDFVLPADSKIVDALFLYKACIATFLNVIVKSGNFFFLQNFVATPVLVLYESVTVVVAHEDSYCKDPEILKGWMDLKIKALAKKKYSPVVINYATWRNLPDREKIPFLMREIKQAVQEEPIGKTNSLF